MRGATLLGRAGSGPTQSTLSLGSPRGHEHTTHTGIYFLRRSRSSGCLSPRSLRMEAKSEASLVGSPLMSSRTVLPPNKIVDEVVVVDEEEAAALGTRRINLRLGIISTETDTLSSQVQGVEFSGGGKGKEGRKIGGGGDHGDDDRGGDQNGMRSYYQQMLKADPGNPLLLRNYGQFLHDVEGDTKRAEECYERAILESPGDGEVLSLYGKLIWETQRDEVRADDYFKRAVDASPADCFVLGSYASFLWDAEDEEDEERDQPSSSSSSSSSSTSSSAPSSYHHQHLLEVEAF